MHEVERKRQTQHFTQEMGLRSHATRSKTVFSRIGFDQRDEPFEVARRQRRVDRYDVGRGDRQRDRGEVLVGVELQFGKKRRVHDVGAECNEEGVAVRCRTRRLGGTDIAGRACEVLDIELLAEMLGELLRGEPRENVGRAARREWNDHADRPRRIGLRSCNPGCGRQYDSARGQMEKLPTGKLHWAPPRTIGYEHGYSALMPAALMIGHHFSVSASWKA